MRADQDPTPAVSTAGTIVFITFGFLVWAGQFAIVYAATTVVCARWNSGLAASTAVVVTTIAALALAAFYLFRTSEIVTLFGLPPDPEVREQLLKTGRIVAFLSIVVILWTGCTIAFVDACVPGR